MLRNIHHALKWKDWRHLSDFAPCSCSTYRRSGHRLALPTMDLDVHWRKWVWRYITENMFTISSHTYWLHYAVGLEQVFHIFAHICLLTLTVLSATLYSLCNGLSISIWDCNQAEAFDHWIDGKHTQYTKSIHYSNMVNTDLEQEKQKFFVYIIFHHSWTSLNLFIQNCMVGFI